MILRRLLRKSILLDNRFSGNCYIFKSRLPLGKKVWNRDVTDWKLLSWKVTSSKFDSCIMFEKFKNLLHQGSKDQDYIQTG